MFSRKVAMLFIYFKVMYITNCFSHLYKYQLPFSQMVVETHRQRSVKIAYTLVCSELICIYHENNAISGCLCDPSKFACNGRRRQGIWSGRGFPGSTIPAQCSSSSTRSRSANREENRESP